MKRSDDTATISRLRSDVALQISRFLQTRQLSQASAAKVLRISQSTVRKMADGQVSGLSLELLLRIAVRAGLDLVLQTGIAPEEAGAFLSTADRTGSRSKLADNAEDAPLAAARDMTPEQRLIAHLQLSELLASSRRAGRAVPMRARGPAK